MPPKDWFRHKAEIERLYIVEQRPLTEVREMLKARHGFNASIRAFRMKFDEWELRKYKSNKQTPSRRVFNLSASAPINFQTTKPAHELQMYFGQIAIPMGPLKASEVLQLIQGPSKYDYALEIMLIKWQPGGEYMKEFTPFLQRPEYCKCIMEPKTRVRNLFKLVTDSVPPAEQFPVTKALLEAAVEVSRNISLDSPEWAKVWRGACDEDEWQAAKRHLDSVDLFSLGAGKLFRDCALVVTAERLLQGYMTRIESFRTATEPLSAFDAVEAESCRRNYMSILKSFYPTKLDVNPSWYKYSIYIQEWHAILAGNVDEVERKRIQLVDENRHKYLRLISLYAGVQEDGIDLVLDDLVYAAQSTQSQRTVGEVTQFFDMASPGHALELAGANYSFLANHTDSQAQILPPTQDLFHHLFSIWNSGGKESLVQASELAIRKDGVSVSIFQPLPNICNGSMFDIITNDIPKTERLALTKAFLSAFSEVGRQLLYSQRDINWWNTVYQSSSWNHFKNNLSTWGFEQHLGKAMSSEAVDLVVDSTFLLVGEAFLGSLKQSLDDLHQRKAGEFELENHDFFRGRYTNILSDFRKRKLKASHQWYTYLLTLLEWETGSWGDEIGESEEDSEVPDD